MSKTHRLYQPKYLKSILEKYEFTFKKSLGQNFLIDGNILREISQGAMLTKEDTVLEIGPGFGVLTEQLAMDAKKVISVEIDSRAIGILSETLSDYDNVQIIEADFMKLDLAALLGEERGPIKVVANLPYYVTTPILGKLMEQAELFNSMTFMVQKEVGERMVSEPGTKTYGALSLFVQFYSDPKIVCKVSRNVFMPQPNVDSIVVQMNIKQNIPDIDKDLFFYLVKKGFGQRRKTLLNALSAGEDGDFKEQLNAVMEKLDISPRRRAETLSVQDFIVLTKEFSASLIKGNNNGYQCIGKI